MAANKVRNAFKRINETSFTADSYSLHRFATKANESIESDIPTEFWDNAFDDWAFGKISL